MFRTPSLGDSIWQNCSEEFAGGEVRLYTSLQQGEQAVWSSKIRYQVKEFSVLCVGRCKPLGSLNSLLSYAPQPSGQSCFLVHLASCIPPAPQQSRWGAAASCGLQFWEPSFTFEGQKSLMAVTFLAYWYGRRYFHFTTKSEKTNIATERATILLPVSLYLVFLESTHKWDQAAIFFPVVT